jgi:polar amino acid transport system substrate-binding protein
MKHAKTLFSLLLLASAVSLALGDEASSKQSDTQSIADSSLQPPCNETELMTFVQSAAAHAHVVGELQAIKDFMDLEGPWVRGETYIFAHDFNGTTLSLPYLPSAVGTNRLSIQDAEGRYINRDMQAIAMNGSGFYQYLYRNPVTNQTEPKVSYVMKVDDTWWLGSGIYLPEENKTLIK